MALAHYRPTTSRRTFAARLSLALLLAMLPFCIGAASARESTPAVTARTRASLVTDTDSVAPGAPFRAALRLVLAPGWHTYGAEPGDAGVPTELTLTLPDGAQAGPIEWPAPQRFTEGPVTTFGYDGTIMLPIKVTLPPGTTPPAGGAPVVAQANWLVCKDICIPESGTFRVDLPLGAPAPSAEARWFAAAPGASAPGAAAMAVTEAGSENAADETLPRLLLFALLGGLVLNLMPCVFPVLAMKAVSLAGGVVRGEVRAQALSYSAGVVLAFAALGAALLGARALGSAVGWGFQFQSPVFVASMALLLFAIGLNLSGVFELGGGFAGAGHGLASRHGHIGSFFTGLLAVLVATPCTAPFMGLALAAALGAPAPAAMAIFVAMGLGLAAPTLLLAAVPALARLAPRPGRWMLLLKQALAFPMYAAAVWLVWVVSQQSGPDGVLLILGAMLLIGFAAWALGAGQHRRGAWIGRVAAVVAVVAAVPAVARIGLAPEPATGGSAAAREGVEPFTAARLDALRTAGRPVFVDMTAAWCVTCLVNERVAIDRASVRQAFGRQGVTYLKGDWTRQDPEITAFLRAHGREGVPLYVYFPPDAAPPRVLPQILTEGTILDELGDRRG